MKAFYRISFLLIFISVSFFSFSQYDNEEDLDFQTIKTKKIRENKRKFNIHFEAGYSLSTIFGTQVEYLKDTLKAYDFKLDPNYFPYGKINASFNFSEKLSLTLGLKYSRLGWKEIFKVNNSTTKYIYYNRYDFDYIALPIALNFHANKYLSFNFGHTYSILLSSKFNTYEYYKRNGNVQTDKKTQQSFEDLAGFRPSPLISQIYLGTEIGTKRLRFSASFLLANNFIRPDIYYSSFSIEAGILFKILNDYE